MDRFKFVHAADLHLGSPMGAALANASAASVLRSATFRTFERIVDLCLREKVAFLALAGDLYDTKDRSVRARLFLRDQLSRLDKAGISTFIVHGNHDPLAPGAGRLNLPPSVKVFGTAWQEESLLREGVCYCRVQGISYGQERVEEDLSRFFRRQGPEFTVGLLHTNVGGDRSHANYSPCLLSELSSRDLNYWALGHVHSRNEYPLDSGGVAVYPGNCQGRHARETGPRGCVLVEVSGQSCKRTFIPLDCVRWHLEELDLAETSSLEQVVDGLCDRLDGIKGDSVEAHVIRLVLTGNTSLHSELASEEALQGLQAELGRVLSQRTPPILLESIENRTAGPIDLHQILAAGGLSAEVVNAARAAQKHAAKLQLICAMAQLDKLDAALGRAGLPKLTDSGALVERAMHRALSLLMEREA